MATSLYHEMSYGQAQVRCTQTDGKYVTWSVQPPNGPNVAVSWDEDEGQWYISILTEDGDVPADKDDCPYLFVEINGSTIHDHTPKSHDLEHIRK